MTEDNTPEEEPRPRGSMRRQDAENTTPREPSLAEQRARRKALLEEKEREAAEQQAKEQAERRADTRRKVLIGSGVTVGLVGLIASYYTVAQTKEVTAVCTNDEGVVVDEKYCDEGYVRSQGGHVSGGFLFLPIGMGGGGGQYRYNYGGSGRVGQPVSGGSFQKPSNASINTKSGKSVQRGGFGISGKSGGFGKGGGS
ncbi:hypothetical protein [Amycolatopsis cihanbeyliensis]|uniref:Uncharacterized protein n=1 Tax=Amycolatopsis cihanbeyliensis TaxID=1128664 RepID=A0A542DM09_AMYCI|nr:hypothetical protein [Amycolatopsis cihanbeyliensis]TQJ04133.1 hypothetical protein FB471_3914 [Amycolatopsis cihanbeyliensis]